MRTPLKSNVYDITQTVHTDECKQDIRGSHKEWDTHLKGLQELLYLRGGVEGIETNEFLRVTISW